MIIELDERKVLLVEMHDNGQLSRDFITQLTGALDQAEDSESIMIILFHLRGQMHLDFVADWPGPTDIQTVSRWERLLRRIERTNLTTIVFAEHSCSGLALELLLVGDCRLANRTFYTRHPQLGQEVWPGMALYRLSRQSGEAFARKLILNDGDLTSAFALQMHLIDEIIDESEGNFAQIARFLARVPLGDFAVRRRLIQDSQFTSFEEALGVHLAACDRALRRSPIEIDKLAAAQND